MKVKNKLYTKYLDLLNIVDDYYRWGYKMEHKNSSVINIKKSGNSYNDSSLKINDIDNEIRNCKKCGLHIERKTAVPGEGVTNPLVLIIGEGPGVEEDKTGRPFVGNAGKYLEKWLSAVNFNADENLGRNTNVYIANIIKCRPPGNRDPKPDEIKKCRPYLERQIEILKPCVILTISRFAAQVLLNTELGITKLRGKVYKYKNIPLVPTYHPSAVLRNPELRSPVWDDLKLLKTEIKKNL